MCDSVTMPNKKYPCIQCQKEVKDGISCGVCDRWIHKECVDETIYKLVMEMHTKFGSHIWSCEGCTLAFANLQKRVQNQEAKLNELTKVVKSVQSDCGQNKADIAENRTLIADNTDRISKVEELAKESKDSNSQDAIKEMDERSRKQKNLILHGVEEQDGNLSGNQRKKLDSDIITEIINSTLVSMQPDTDIKFVTRIGVRTEGRKRPICIGFKNATVRDEVLEKINLETSHPNYSLSPDLTKMQLLNEKKLKEEAKKNNEDLSEEDAKKYVWKLVGQYGLRRLIRSSIKPPQPARGRLTSTKRPAEDMDDLEEQQEMPTRSKTRRQ